MFLVTEQDIMQFEKVMNDLSIYSVLLPKNAGGLVLQWRLTFDLYYFLTNHDDKLIEDSFTKFSNPYTAYILELVTKCEKLKKLKRVNKPSQHFCYLFSILFSKHILNLLNVSQNYKEVDVQPYRNEDAGQAVVGKLTLLTVKQLFINDYSIDDIVAQVLKEAQSIDHYIFKGDVDAYK